MHWLLLILGGIFEIGFTFCLGKAKETAGNGQFVWYIGFAACLAVSMYLLVKATQSLPLGTAYAVWTGIGAVGTVLIGIFVFNDPISFLRILFITTLIASVIGLKVVSAH